MNENSVRANATRMVPWVILSALFYFIAFMISDIEQFRQLSTIAWKLGNVTIAAFVGYWIDRHLHGRITPDSVPMLHIRRAIVVGATILAVAMGL